MENQKFYTEVDKDYHDEYDEALNENGPIKIGILAYDTAYVLKNIDKERGVYV